MTRRARKFAEMTEFERWIASLVADRYETSGKLARAIEMSDSAFSRQVRGGTLGPEALLRLARETGRPPGEVLRLAGKETLAVLLEELYGEPAVRLTGPESRLLQVFRTSPKSVRDLMIRVGEVYPSAPTGPPDRG